MGGPHAVPPPESSLSPVTSTSVLLHTTVYSAQLQEEHANSLCWPELVSGHVIKACVWRAQVSPKA